MNFNEMQSAWNPPGNDMSEAEKRRLAESFTRQMMRRRRFQAFWLINTFFWLTLITVLACRTVASGKVDLEQEWALVPFLIIPWLFAFHFLRRFFNPRTPTARGELPIADSFHAALESNRSEQAHLKKVGLLFGIMIPILAVCMYQLHAVGKVSPRELGSMAVFFGVVLTLSSAGIAARYFGRVRPQCRKLNGLIAELREAR